MDMFRFVHPAVLLGQHERYFLEFRVEAVFLLKLNDVAFDDVTVAADDFDELPGHGCSSFFAPREQRYLIRFVSPRGLGVPIG
jgi:hypothetical protein